MAKAVPSPTSRRILAAVPTPMPASRAGPWLEGVHRASFRPRRRPGRVVAGCRGGSRRGRAGTVSAAWDAGDGDGLLVGGGHDLLDPLGDRDSPDLDTINKGKGDIAFADLEAGRQVANAARTTDSATVVPPHRCSEGLRSDGEQVDKE